nr:hypothetical protein [Propionibacterium freudenreichii]
MVLTVFGEATVHVGEARADAVLMPLQGVEVDGVGEVRRKQLVGFGFQACPIRGEVSEFLIVPGTALVERRIHVSGQALVGGVADRDEGVGVCDESFRESDGHRPSRAVGLLGGSAGADEVGVGCAAWVGREVQEHP